VLASAAVFEATGVVVVAIAVVLELVGDTSEKVVPFSGPPGEGVVSSEKVIPGVASGLVVCGGFGFQG